MGSVDTFLRRITRLTCKVDPSAGLTRQPNGHHRHGSGCRVLSSCRLHSPLSVQPTSSQPGILSCLCQCISSSPLRRPGSPCWWGQHSICTFHADPAPLGGYPDRCSLTDATKHRMYERCTAHHECAGAGAPISPATQADVSRWPVPGVQECRVTSASARILVCWLAPGSRAGSNIVRVTVAGSGAAQHRGRGAPFALPSPLAIDGVSPPGVSLGGGATVTLTGAGPLCVQGCAFLGIGTTEDRHDGHQSSGSGVFF